MINTATSPETVVAGHDLPEGANTHAPPREAGAAAVAGVGARAGAEAGPGAGADLTRDPGVGPGAAAALLRRASDLGPEVEADPSLSPDPDPVVQGIVPSPNQSLSPGQSPNPGQSPSRGQSLGEKVCLSPSPGPSPGPSLVNNARPDFM